MNVIAERQQRREAIIREIGVLVNAQIKAGEQVNKKKLVIMVMAKFSVTKRTASEYLDVALYNTGIDI